MRLKLGCHNRGHAGYRSSRSIDRAQVNGLSECEVVGIEKTLLAVRQYSIAQHLQERLLNVIPKIIRVHANLQFDLELNILGRFQFNVLTGQPIAFHGIL